MTKALNKAIKDYYKRLGKWLMPGYIIGIIGLIVLIAGIWFKLQIIANFGTLFLGAGAMLIGIA